MCGFRIVISQGKRLLSGEMYKWTERRNSQGTYKTEGIIGVNVMVALSNYADMVRTAIEEKIDVVFSGAGLPLDLPSYLTPESVTKLVPIVSSLRAAKVICDKWQKTITICPMQLWWKGLKPVGI